MAKWWMGVAVLLCGLTVTAQAQNPYMAYQAKPAVMPEPVPFAQAPVMGANPPVAMPYPSAQPPAGVPGPGCVPGLPSQDSGNSLRSDTPNAWDENQPCENGCYYTTFGLLAMTRERLSHRAAATLDNGSDTITSGESVFASFRDVGIRPNYGVRTLVGYHCDTSACEVSGFYLSQNNSMKTSAGANSLDAAFFNPPVGFEGDPSKNGMWLQSDLLRTSLRTAVGSGEAVYRWWLAQDTGLSWNVGVRYLDLDERFNFFSGVDDLTVFDVNGNPDPTRQATYGVTAHNHICAGQLGLEWDREINTWLAFSFTIKGAWGANLADVDTYLNRGDGFQGFAVHRERTIFSHLYEAGFFLNARLMDNCRLRGGYNLLWAVDVANAVDQLDYNLANTAGQQNYKGSVFYQGLSLELSLLF